MATIESGDFVITSNHESEAAMRAVMGVESNDAGNQASDEGHDAVIPGSTDAGSESGRAGGDQSSGEDAGESNRSTDRRADDAVPAGAVGKKARDNPQARISQAVAKQREAERKAADLEARLQALEQSRPAPAPQQPPVAPPSPVATGKPSWQSFEEQVGVGLKYATWGEAQDAYADARDSWNRQEWLREQQQQAELAERRKVATDHLARVEVAKKQYPDYQEALTSVEHVRVSPVLEAAILKLPNSADVVYWLATHPDEFTQLASETLTLDVVAAPIVRRLLEARVGAGARSGSVPSAELPRTKPPIRPVGASSVSVPDDPGDDEPVEQYIARMNAADRKRGRL